MQSLRTRQSQAPRRRQAAKVSISEAPRPRDNTKSRVDDKIKKRMSMRYATISNPTHLNQIPSVPSLPTSLTPGHGTVESAQEEAVRDRTGAWNEFVNDDKKLLDDDNFDPDTFMKLKLANSTEAELKSLESSLGNTKSDTALELQRNVFKNYAEFVLISKEISNLENEMLELKESISEYKSMPSLLHIPDPTSISSATLSTYKRSSVADLRIMYFNQMQSLHAQVEGAAKFAPITPGRHVVGEVEGVFALNAATYKVSGKVKFIILDDAVLVARRRRRTAASEARGSSTTEGKLVAERCWPLNEMLVLDTKDSASMTNVFKIRHGKETHVYRTDGPGDKKLLLSQFRQVAEELAAKKRKEREGEHERRKSMWQGGDTSLSGVDRMPPVPDWINDLGKRAADSESGSDGREKTERDTKWIGEWSDDLTVAIALREWEKAVQLVEQGNSKLTSIPGLAAKLTPLTTQLTSALLASLSLPTNQKSSVVSLISLLLRLKAGPQARTTFLEMRSEVLRRHVRKIRFDGQIGSYVGDLAVVYFTGIKHTADWFLASFKENEVASSFIDWAKQQIEAFAEMFRRQVYSSDVDPKVVEEAIDITYTQRKKLLQEYGLDFRHLFDQLLVEKPNDIHDTPTAFTFRDHRVSKPPEGLVSSPSQQQGLPRRRSPPPPPPMPSDLPPILTRNISRPSNFSSRTSPAPPSAFSQSQAQYGGAQSSPRPRTPVPAASSTPTSPKLPPPVPLVAPIPRRTRSPVRATPSDIQPPLPLPSGLSSARERPPRVLRGSPAPPPRSTNRPASLTPRHPVVPAREGMI